MSRQKELETSDYPTLDSIKRQETLRWLARHNSRRNRKEELLAIPAIKLEDKVLASRISELTTNYENIVSLIPIPLTLHPSSEEDIWNLHSGVKEDGISPFLFMKRPDPYNENEVFYMEICQGHPLIIHTENRQPELSFTQNSEREMGPAEELYWKLMQPVNDLQDLRLKVPA
jgi:hypothetical protein